MINKLKVFVPAHITGFFEIMTNDDPILKGSKGAGITLDKGVITETTVEVSATVKIVANSFLTFILYPPFSLKYVIVIY